MVEVSQKLRRAAAKHRQAEEALKAAREELAAAIVADAERGVSQVDIIEVSGYNREHVRRLERKGGVQGRK